MRIRFLVVTFILNGLFGRTQNCPTAFAGLDIETCMNMAILSGSPASPPCVGNWTILMGAATIANPNDPNSMILDLHFGESVLQWSVEHDGDCITSDIVSVFRYDVGLPAANAGPDIEICNHIQGVKLCANALLYPTVGTWSVVQGAGNFSCVHKADAYVTDFVPGVNIFRWTIDHSPCGPVVHDDISLIVFPYDEQFCPDTSNTAAGCTVNSAINYNASADWDDGTCLFGAWGCTSPLADNYTPGFYCDDGSCIYVGCMNPTACNYSSLNSVDNGSCTFPGCTVVNACNYNPLAGCEEGNCVFPGCTDPNAINFNCAAGCDDGSCILLGCTNATACNYDSAATLDDNTCIFPLIEGDLNCDDVLDVEDVLVLLDYYGCSVYCGTADLNVDGIVNVEDVLLFAAMW